MLHEDGEKEADSGESSLEPSKNNEPLNISEQKAVHFVNCVNKVKEKINDACPEYERYVLGSLLFKFIDVSCSQQITNESFESIEAIFLEKGSVITKEIKKFQFNVEVILKACLVYGLSLQPEFYLPNYRDPSILLSEYHQYPHFSDRSRIDATEMACLLCFRRFMKISLEYIPARRNKQLLIAICALLEGSGRVYITGGTQSAATTRRTTIFEHESGLEKIRRPSRSKVHDEDAKNEEDGMAGELLVSGEDTTSKKKLITCKCGAVILKRTMWKHNQSKRHIQFEQFTQCSSITTLHDEDEDDEEYEDDQS